MDSESSRTSCTFQLEGLRPSPLTPVTAVDVLGPSVTFAIGPKSNDDEHVEADTSL